LRARDFCLSSFVSLSGFLSYFLVASFDGLRPLLVAAVVVHSVPCSLANELRSLVGSFEAKPQTLDRLQLSPAKREHKFVLPRQI